MTKLTGIPDAARKLHEHGGIIITYKLVPDEEHPEKKPRKVPLFKEWTTRWKDGQSDIEFENLRWLEADGWGIVCGCKIGEYHLVAIDCDNLKFEEACQNLLPETVQEQTPFTHGSHRLYLSKTNPRGKKVDGLEYLGVGNYVAMYPIDSTGNDYGNITKVEDAFDLFANVAEALGIKVDEHSTVNLPEILKGVPHGIRDFSAVRLATWYRKEGRTQQETFALLKEWDTKNYDAETRQSEPLGDKILLQKIESAFKPEQPYKYRFADSLPELTKEGHIELLVDERIATGQVASQLLKMHRFAYTIESHKLYYYNNGVYSPRAEEMVQAEVQRAFRKIGLFQKPGKRFIEEIIGHICRSTYISQKQFDKDPNILNLKNCLFNLDTGEQLPHTPEYLSRKQLPIAYNVNATCPGIMKFLSEIQPDEQDQLDLIEHASLPLLKSNFIQKAFMYGGVGRNGKSIWFEIITRVYGEENATHVSIHSLVTDRFAPARLDGKMLNVYDDISSEEIEQTGIPKQIIAGSPGIGVQNKGKTGYDMYPPYPILYFAVNQLPTTEDLTEAWMRRWEYKEFLQKFDIQEPNQQKKLGQDETDAEAAPNADRIIAEKIATPPELEGLLLKLIQAARKIKKNQRLTHESKIEQVTEEWIMKSDITIAFLKERTTPDVQALTSKELLRIEYDQYCRDHKYIAKGDKTLAQKLKTYCRVEDSQLPPTQGRKHAWKGIKLKPAKEPPQ